VAAARPGADICCLHMSPAAPTDEPLLAVSLSETVRLAQTWMDEKAATDGQCDGLETREAYEERLVAAAGDRPTAG